MKKGRFTNEEKDYIKNNSNKSIKELSETLSRSLLSVQNFINTLPNTPAEEPRVVAGRSRVIQNIVHDTENKTSRVTIMTPSAESIIAASISNNTTSRNRYNNDINKVWHD